MTHPGKSKQAKSKSALINAFDELVLQRPYSEFHIADIISAADVSRSTFYEHFRNKEDILRLSLTGILGPLANAGFDEGDVDGIAFVLEHFREFESLAKVYLNEPIFNVVVSLLGELVESRLGNEVEPSSCSFPLNLLASQIASSTMGVIKTWLGESGRVNAQDLASQLQLGSEAIRLSAVACRDGKRQSFDS